MLHLVNSPASTFRPSMTISPAITALVVAMAGIMLPAMAEGEGRGGGERRDMTKEHSHEIADQSALLLDVEGKGSQGLICRRCHKVHCNSVILHVGMDWYSWMGQINKSVSVPYPTLVLPWQCAAH